MCFLKCITKHIYVSYYHPLSIIMKALRTTFRKSGTECIFSCFATLRFKILQAHVAVDLIRSHHGSPTTAGSLRFRQIAMVGESKPHLSGYKSVVQSSNRPDHTALHVQFSSDQSTNLIQSRKRNTCHIYVGYYHPLSIIMRARRVIIRKSGTECIFSKFATRRFKMLQAHVAVDLIRSHHGFPTTAGGLRTRRIAMVGE